MNTKTDVFRQAAIASLMVLPLFLIPTRTTMALEEPEFELLGNYDGYEVRRYRPYLVAEVDVVGDKPDRRAFRILAGYIFGANDDGEKMKMTAPVESRDKTADDDFSGQDVKTYAFVMERKFGLDTLPRPDDKRIRLLERPGRVMAVRRYSGGWSESKFSKNRDALLDALKDDYVVVAGDAEFARYNSPFKPGFLRRNEVLIPIAW